MCQPDFEILKIPMTGGRKEEQQSCRARESGGKEKNILLATSGEDMGSEDAGVGPEVCPLNVPPPPFFALSLSISLPLTLSHSLSLCPPFLSVELCVRKSCRRVKLLSVSLAHRCSLYVCSCDRCSLMVC